MVEMDQVALVVCVVGLKKCESDAARGLVTSTLCSNRQGSRVARAPDIHSPRPEYLFHLEFLVLCIIVVQRVVGYWLRWVAIV